MRTKVLDYTIGGVALAAFFLLMLENSEVGRAFPAFFRTANMLVLSAFAADVLFRFASSEDKRQYVRRRWFDVVVFVPLVQYIPAVRGPNLFVVIRQIVIVVMLISRSRRAGKLLQLLSLRPAQAMVAGFLGAVGVGSVLLLLPISTVSGRMSLVDAVFTATSAVCVTGLIVQDTATYFTVFGQLVILGLIQAGGLGIMTFSVSLAVFTGRQMDVRSRAALQDALDSETLAGVRGLIRFIIVMTLGFEAAGALCLAVRWYGRAGGVAETCYHAVFHSVSAFCNAGFSTFSDSMVRFAADAWTNVFVCALIVAGGVGFLVIRDLVHAAGGLGARGGRARSRLRVQTKVVLVMTLLLIVAGAILFYAVERGHSLTGRTAGESICQALFQSVTARTAGFNTVDIGMMSSSALLIMVVLMFVGASPGSTGGGVKTTTVAALWAAVVSNLRHRGHAELFRRTLPWPTVLRAVTLLCFALMLVVGFTTVLLYTEDQRFRDIVFETVSAFATVGLSTGITGELSIAGKWLIACLMFTGRLGPLTMAYALMKKRPAVRYEFPEERLMIG